MSSVNFQKLFRTIYNAPDDTNEIVRNQQDTSFLDGGDFNTDKRKKKMRQLEPDVDKLLKCTVIVSSDTYNKGSNRKKTLNTKPSIQPIQSTLDGIPLSASIPRINWENEVKLVMEIQDPKELSKALSKTSVLDASKLYLPSKPITYDIAPYYCFEPDSINEKDLYQSNTSYDTSEQNLYRLIPNQTRKIQTLESMLTLSKEDLYDSDEDDNEEVSKLANRTTSLSVTTTHTKDTSSSGINDESNIIDSNKKQTSSSSSDTVTNITTTDNTINDTTKVILSKEERERIMLEDKINRLNAVGIGREAATAMIQRKLGKKFKSDLPNSRNRRYTSISITSHCNAAIYHRDIKFDLSEHELLRFHRPRISTIVKEMVWKLVFNEEYEPFKPLKKSSLKALPNQGGSSTNAVTSSSSTTLTPYNMAHMMMAPVENKVRMYTEAEKQNISPHVGEYVCIEYIEENLPIYMNTGMASTIYNYYRLPLDQQQEDNDEEEDEDDDGVNESGGDKNADSANKEKNKTFNLQKALANYQHRIPRYLHFLLHNQNQKSTTDNTALLLNAPKLLLGETKVLKKDDESPFLGEIEENEIQPAISNNLYKAPLFPHRPHLTDFLLIRIKAPKSGSTADKEGTNATEDATSSSSSSTIFTPKTVCFVVRKIPQIFVCGQVEPLKIVPRPNNKVMTKLQEKMTLLSAARFLKSVPEGVEFGDLLSHILKYNRRKITFKNDIIRKLLRDKMAVDLSTAQGKRWFYREYVTAQEYDANIDISSDWKQYSVEELERTLLPEDICIQHACDSYEFKLSQYGIYHDVDIHRVRLWLDRMQKLKTYRIDSLAYMKIYLNTYVTTSEAYQNISFLYQKGIQELQQLQERIEIGQFIYERLVFAPWNSTECYIRSHVERDGNGVLELIGKGDPSGKGEGFAYIRAGSLQSSAASKRAHEQLVNTDKDLRKLTRKDLHRLLIGFGVTEKEFMNLKRWDMVDLVRMHSTKAERSGISTSLHKYARGGMVPIKDMSKKESFSEIANAIWKRQKKALAAPLTTIQPIISSKSSTDLISKPNDSNTMAVDKTADTANDDEENEDDEDDDDWLEEQLGLEDDLEKTIKRRMNAIENDRKLQREKAQKEEALTRKEDKENYKSMKELFHESTTGSSSGSSAIGLDTTTTAAGVGVGSSSISLKLKTGSVQPSSISTIPSTTIPSYNYPRPAKVVKKTIRRIKEDGTESIEVIYLLSAKEVDRVMNEVDRKYREDMAMKASGSKRKYGVDDEDDYEDSRGTKLLPDDFKLKLSKGKKGKNRDDSDDDEFVYGKNRRSITSSTRRMGGDVEEEDIDYKPRTGATARSGGIRISTRMPHVQLASKLENEMMKIWKKPSAEVFRYPVPRTIAGYYDVIKSPICLQDIVHKIVTFQYHNVKGLLNDMNQLYQNSSDFNQPTHPITKDAKLLYNTLELALTHDFKTLGPDRDEYTLLEQAIQKKQSFLGLAPIAVSASNLAVFSSTHTTSSSSSSSIAPPMVSTSKSTAPAAVVSSASKKKSSTTSTTTTATATIPKKTSDATVTEKKPVSSQKPQVVVEEVKEFAAPSAMEMNDYEDAGDMNDAFDDGFLFDFDN